MWLNRQTGAVLGPSIIKSLDYWNQSSTGLLTGQSGIFPLALIWQVSLALRGCRPHTIDCAMRGNAFTIADEAMRRKLQPEAILITTTIQRAFTPYQILDVLHEILRHPGDRAYTILAPCKQFLDGDVAEDESVYLLNKLVQTMQIFSEKNIPLFIVETEKYKHPAFPDAFRKIKQMARPIFELGLLEKEFNMKYSMRISKTEQLMGQTSRLGENYHYGTNTPTLFDTNRSRKRTIQRVQERSA